MGGRRAAWAVLAVVALGLGPGAPPTAAATVVVTTTADGGPGSLRAAIAAANAAAGGDTITFALADPPAADGTWTIRPATALPPITDALVVEGPRRSDGTPAVLLDGGLVPTARGLDLRVGSTVRGLSIGGFDVGVHVEHTVGGSRIEASHVGVRPDGRTALPNRIGISLGGNATVGGAAGAGNLISGNAGEGVFADDPADGTVVRGNRIGQALDGSALGNGGGVFMLSQGTIADNVIVAGSVYGVRIDLPTLDVTVTGNRIGSAGAGLGNGVGVLVSSRARVGGVGAGEANTIEGNARDGVEVSGTRVGTIVRGNAIRDNGGAGIDLEPDPALGGAAGTATPDDAGDVDTGPNGLQNAPGAPTVVSGPAGLATVALSSTPSTSYLVDVYASSACDPVGRGEGGRWLGSVPVTTDAAGQGQGSGPLDVPAQPGEAVTATATGPEGTSELSPCGTAAGPPGPAPGPDPGPDPSPEPDPDPSPDPSPDPTPDPTPPPSPDPTDDPSPDPDPGPGPTPRPAPAPPPPRQDDPVVPTRPGADGAARPSGGEGAGAGGGTRPRPPPGGGDASAAAGPDAADQVAADVGGGDGQAGAAGGQGGPGGPTPGAGDDGVLTPADVLAQGDGPTPGGGSAGVSGGVSGSVGSGDGPTGPGGGTGDATRPALGFEVPTSLAELLDPVAIAAALLVSTAMVLVLGLSSAIFNETIKENEQVIRGWFRRFRPLTARVRRLTGRVPPAGLLVGVLLSHGLLAASIDPGFPTADYSLRLLAGAVLGELVIGVLAIGPTLVAERAATGRWGSVRVVPISLLVAIACVAASRLLDFVPGYLFGATLAVALPRTMARARFGRLKVATHVLLLTAAAAAFAGRGALAPALAVAHPSALDVADTLLLVVLVAGTESTAIGLLPLWGMDGAELRACRPRAWAVLWLTGIVSFTAVVLHPASGFWRDGDVVGVVSLFVAFGILTAATRWWFRRLAVRRGGGRSFPTVPPPPPAASPA